MLAMEFGAKVIYDEHRFFGKSYPVFEELESTKEECNDLLYKFEGDESSALKDLLSRNWKYLSVDQAVRDFVELARLYNPKWDRPLYVFGSGYGGMVATLLR